MDKKILEHMTIRDYVPSDKEFIYSTWLRGLRYGSAFHERVEPENYFKKMSNLIQNLLLQAEVRVACLNDDPNVILGYAVLEGKTLHWVYMKEVWRHLGIAELLVPKDLQKVTHLTDLGEKILKVKFPKATFNPF